MQQINSRIQTYVWSVIFEGRECPEMRKVVREKRKKTRNQYNLNLNL